MRKREKEGDSIVREQLRGREQNSGREKEIQGMRTKKRKRGRGRVRERVKEGVIVCVGD